MENEIEVMRIIRVPPRGKLVVSLGDRRFQKLSEIEDPAAQQRVRAAVAELIVFVDGYHTLVDAGLAPPLTSAQDADLPESMEARQAAFLATLKQQTEAEKSASNPASFAQFIPGLGRPRERLAPETPALNVVEQIDILLQKHLAAFPELAHRTVHLEEDPSGGIRIVVDGRSYPRPSDVADTQIRTAIRNALKEWDSA